MDPSTRLRRHSELYEAGTSSVQRIAVGGLIFAALILFNVIEPYYRADMPALEQAVLSKQLELDAIDRNLQSIAQLDAKLGQIANVIAAQPWYDDVENLKRYFRQGAGGNVQERADTTIRDIAAKINEQVVEPLQTAVTDSGMTGAIASIPTEIAAAVDTWQAQRIGNSDWFRTIDAKERSTSIISDSLQDSINSASAAIAEISSAQEVRRAAENRRKNEVDAVIASLHDDLADAVDTALPAWAKGLISPDTLIKLFPWILTTIAALLLLTALKAARHYHGMADAEGWTAVERADPLLSSPWTLTDRGIKGSLITFLRYSAVIALLAYFLYRSANPSEVVEISAMTVSKDLEEATGELLPVIYGLLTLGLLFVGIRVRPKRAD